MLKGYISITFNRKVCNYALFTPTILKINIEANRFFSRASEDKSPLYSEMTRLASSTMRNTFQGTRSLTSPTQAKFPQPVFSKDFVH